MFILSRNEKISSVGLRIYVFLEISCKSGAVILQASIKHHISNQLSPKLNNSNDNENLALLVVAHLFLKIELILVSCS